MAQYTSVNLQSRGPIADFIEAAVSQKDILMPGSKSNFAFERTPTGGVLKIDAPEDSARYDYDDNGKLSIPVAGKKLKLGGKSFNVRGEAARLLTGAFLSPLGQQHGITGKLESGGYDSDKLEEYGKRIISAKAPGLAIHTDWDTRSVALLQRDNEGNTPTAAQPFFNHAPYLAWQKVAGATVNNDTELKAVRIQVRAKLAKLAR